jgi:SNF2 family DNA or RNA helicase
LWTCTRRVCAGTLEERIDEMIAKKRGLAARVVGQGEGWLTEMSLDELRFVMALRPEAVSE